ncbi:MAG: hypothetical protein AB7S75_19070 [Desulfococcaceae bacterium]
MAVIREKFLIIDGSLEKMINQIHKIEAERLRIALMCGCDSSTTVIAWADSIINLQFDVDYLVIDISLTRPEKIKELISLLRKLGQETDHDDALRCVLGRASFLAGKGEFNLRNFAKWLYFTESTGWDLPSDLNFVYSTDDEYSLAEDGVFGSLEDVDAMFLNNLNEFESEQSASPDWYSAALHTNR